MLLILHQQHPQPAQRVHGARVCGHGSHDRRVRGHGVGSDDRQAHGEGRPLVLARAIGGHAATVQLDQLPRDRQAEPEPALLPGGAGIRLAEALEQVGQELTADPDARVADLHLDVTRASD